MDIVLERRSVRKFDLDKMIPYNDMLDLVRHGEAAGTARRQKSREYVIIDNKELINKIASIYTKSTMNVSLCNQMIAVVGKNPRELSTPRMQSIDLALATQNIMVYAVSKKIGSVMLGTYPLEDRMSLANEALGLSDGRFVFTFICLGYPLEGEKAFYDMNKFDLSDVTYIK